MQNMGKFLAKANSSGSLEQLKMSNCKLGDLELKQLSRGLMISRTLRVLDLSQNQIKNVGYVKEGIQSNIALEKLDLSSN
jgi:Leucine-rich repeat (LRR) protein